ncbi:hypothetical protein SO802_012350 [Lithocarpus litseifolius]|uniref:Uncharacterized protein n=1 Tax=Lithocarpus litseifolius TaxID=425828 RepID=A0AAW2D3W2_9ROSI
MNTQELLNTMVASQIQLREDMNLMVKQFQNLKSGQEENKSDHNSPTMEGEKKINKRINKVEEMIKRARKMEDLMDYQSLSLFLDKIPIDFTPCSNNDVVAMMRGMNYLSRMNLGKTMKNATVQVPIIPTTTPPFGLGFKLTNDDLLEMEVRGMARSKAKAKGLPCPLEPLKPYTLTLNVNKNKYEDEEGREAPGDDDEGSSSKSDSSSDSSSSDSESNNSEDYDSQYSGNDWGEPPSDREDEDDDAEAEPIDMENGTENEESELENVLEAVGEEVEEANNIDYDDYLYGHPSN